jgi:hypothetical protein
MLQGYDGYYSNVLSGFIWWIGIRLLDRDMIGWPFWALIKIKSIDFSNHSALEALLITDPVLLPLDFESSVFILFIFQNSFMLKDIILNIFIYFQIRLYKKFEKNILIEKYFYKNIINTWLGCSTSTCLKLHSLTRSTFQLAIMTCLKSMFKIFGNIMGVIFLNDFCLKIYFLKLFLTSIY